MTTSPPPVITQLHRHAESLRASHLRTLFAEDVRRFSDLSREACGLFYDFSKEILDNAALQALLAWAEDEGLAQKIEALRLGEIVNKSEGQPALHMAWRAGADAEYFLNGENIMPDIVARREQMLAFTEGVRTGEVGAANGMPFRHILHIGTGGSDLGSRMATTALRPYCSADVQLHFAANIDGADLDDKIGKLDPQDTLCLFTSKSFTTLETGVNVRTCIAWLKAGLSENQWQQHVVAITANPEKAIDYAIPRTRIYPFQAWVGGRFSVWSPCGLALAIAVGRDNFLAFLSGAEEMDNHFFITDLENNLPVVAGLIALWRHRFMGFSATATVPYDARLKYFVDYLQQLIMESNGKPVTEMGDELSHNATAIHWGGVGSNVQHSFFQYLHQSVKACPVDFLVAKSPHWAADTKQHHMLVANCLAQGDALAFGEEETKGSPAYRKFSGNRPSTTLVFSQMTPESLGKLMAFYEHRVFVEAAMQNINPFDQWGVELGKRLAHEMINALEIAEDAANISEAQKGLWHILFDK